jgi:hypothetical protein
MDIYQIEFKFTWLTQTFKKTWFSKNTRTREGTSDHPRHWLKPGGKFDNKNLYVRQSVLWREEEEVVVVVVVVN